MKCHTRAARARIKLAINEIDIFSKLHTRFTGKALPDAALNDAAKEFDVSDEAVEEAVDTSIVNLRFVGLLKTLSGAERIVSTDLALDGMPATNEAAPRVSRGTTEPRELITAERAQFEATDRPM